MTDDEKIQLVANRLKDVYYNSSTTYLINFVDDDVDWEAIASVSLDAIKEVDLQIEGEK